MTNTGTSRTRLLMTVLIWAAGAWLLMEAAAAVLYAPNDYWNDIRLARAWALHAGVPLYPPRYESTPIIGTLHLPLSHILYQPALVFSTPSAAMTAGAAISLLLTIGPLAWMFLWKQWNRAGWLAFLACVAVCLQGFVIAFPMTVVHADAAALGLAALGAGLLYRGASPVLAGFCCALCITAKQTMVGVPLGAGLWLLLADWRGLPRYLVGAVGGGVGGAALSVAAAGSVRALADNVFVLATTRPAKENWVETAARGLRWLRWEGAQALLSMVPAVLAWAERGESIFRFLSSNRWTVFLFVAAAQLPVLVRAWMTTGGDVNHLGGLLYFLVIGAVASLTGAEKRMRAGFLTTLLLINLAPAAPLQLVNRLREWGNGPSQVAYEYLRLHPVGVWFPWHPLAHGLAQHALFHVDYSLKDREVAGRTIPAARFRAGLPPGISMVVLPAGQVPDSAVLRQFLSEWRVGQDPALAGWDVYRRP